MTSLVMEIEDYPLEAGVPMPISREATYFLLMTGSDVDMTLYYKGTRIGGAVGLQGGDAVGPLSNQYDKVILKSATAQTVKVATSSDPVTITRLSGVVNVDGVVQTASDYMRSQRGESLFAFAEVQPVSGLYGVMQFENPVDSGKEWIIQSIKGTATNISMAAPIETTLQAVNSNLAFASNRKAGQPRPNINIYKDAVAARPEPQRTHGQLGVEENPFVLPPGGVLTANLPTPNARADCTIGYFEVVV